MNYYLDTEFIEDGRTIDLVSIAIVAADGREYYAEVQEDTVPWYRASAWVLDNVLPNLSGVGTKYRFKIAQDVRQFVGDDPVFWAYYADYDWVVLCQLYGTMIDLPEGWPMYCRDLKQLMDEQGIDSADLPVPDGPEHHALTDARWVRAAHEYIL